jgi:Ubiquitin carboxyl-terminal hydrolase
VSLLHLSVPPPEHSKLLVTVTGKPQLVTGEMGNAFAPPAFKRGLVGLYNFENTCYMNASLQCMSHNPVILEFFLSTHRALFEANVPMPTLDFKLHESHKVASKPFKREDMVKEMGRLLYLVCIYMHVSSTFSSLIANPLSVSLCLSLSLSLSVSVSLCLCLSLSLSLSLLKALEYRTSCHSTDYTQTSCRLESY